MVSGHQKIKDFFDLALKKRSLSQAYLFYGPEKVGKRSFALELAQKTVGFGSGSFGDGLVVISPEKGKKKDGTETVSDIGVEAVREARRKLSLLEKGVCVINDAHRMTKSAQNALLKILEEPRKGLIFFLISSNKDRILETIISRCQKVAFSLLKDDELSKMLPDNVSESEKEALIFWSIGRPGLLKDMLEDRSILASRKDTFDRFKTLFGKDVGERLAVAEALGKDKQEAIGELELFSTILRRMLVLSGKSSINPKSSFLMLEKISRGIEILKSTNANPRLVLENIFLS